MLPRKPLLRALALAVVMATGAVPSLTVLAEENRSTLKDQEAVAVTIYNQDLALVKDTRAVKLPAGVSKLALREVSAQMRPETALLRSLTKPGALAMLEQNFDFDLLTPHKLLEKYVGRKVHIVKTNPATGAETIETAELLSAAEGVVLRIGDRIETGVPGRIVYDDLPANLRDKPTLVTELQNSDAGEHKLELSYLTGGLSWHADYVAELSADDKSLDLNGWVTLTNRSGATYPNARLQLVAGDVNRVQEEMRDVARREVMMKAATAAPASMAQEALFEYHLYTLSRPTTIADNQTKQVSLLNAAAVPVTKELLLQGNDYYYRSSIGQVGQKMKVGVFVEFENREKANLGMPMPKGVVRVYKKDSAGNAQFIGEDRIDHTPKNEKVRLKLGEAFDVTAEKKQMDFKRRESTNPASYVFESAYELVLRNAKKESVTVTVREPIPGDWQMLQESHKHKKAASNTAEWQVNIPANSSTTLKYRTLVRF